MKKAATILFATALIFFLLPGLVKAECPLPAIGDISLSTGNTCSISSVIGADKASSEISTTNTAAVTLPSDTSITINNGGTLALGSIVLSGGSITIQAGGVIEVGKPIYATDSDTDGWLDNTTYYTATSSGLRRLGLMKSISAADCDSGSFSEENTCCSANGVACSGDSGCCSGICGTDSDEDGVLSSSAGHTGVCYASGSYTDCNDSDATVGSHLATGGTITYDSGSGDYIHKFTSSGTFEITCGGDITAEVLVIAGGGGGGYYSSYPTSAGGGGAGGLVYNSSFSFVSGSYTVTVGNGGARNVNGGNSSVSTLSATGGGHGASRSGQTIYAQVGGSGGGGANCCSTELLGAAGIAGQGYAGSTGTSGTTGGGGGAGADSTRPNGGAGATYDISGASVCYAGGGAGVGGAATCGGGSSGYDGTANTGGGGAGTKAGGSGIVVIRYSTF